MAVKRGEGRPLVALDELLARERADLEPAHALTANRIYERRWALTLLAKCSHGWVKNIARQAMPYCSIS